MASSVAVKLISWEGSGDGRGDMRRRALRELRHLRDCKHTHIVRCYGASLWEGALAIVTELLPRGTLHAALANRSLTWGPRWVLPWMDGSLRSPSRAGAKRRWLCMGHLWDGDTEMLCVLMCTACLGRRDLSVVPALQCNWFTVPLTKCCLLS